MTHSWQDTRPPEGGGDGSSLGVRRTAEPPYRRVFFRTAFEKTKLPAPRTSGMASKKQTAPDPGWYGRDEIAVIFGCSVSYLKQEIAALLPADATTTIGRKIYWHAPTVYRVMVSRPRGRRNPRGSSGGGHTGTKQADPADLALREIQAKVAKLESQARLLELQIEQRKGEWITRREWQQRLGELVKRLQTVGDLIRRRGDKRLHRAFNDALLRMARDLEVSDDAASSR